jgi:diacylglycerol kinase
MKIEDRGSRIEDRGSRIEEQGNLDPQPSIFDGGSPSILHPRSSILIARGKRRLWRDKFRESLRGIKLGIRGHSSFFVHFFFAALVSATAIFHGLDESTQPRVRHSLDIAAGAVLLASITAAVIGAIVFLPKLAALLVHFFD